MVPYNRRRATGNVNYRDNSGDEGRGDSRAHASSESDEDSSSRKPAARRNIRRKANSNNASSLERTPRERQLESQVTQLKERAGKAESENAKMRSYIEKLERQLRRKDGDNFHLREEKRELERLLQLMSPRNTRHPVAGRGNSVSPSST